MLEGTNQSSRVHNLSPLLVSRNACTLAGTPTDRLTLDYIVIYAGLSHAPLQVADIRTLC